MYSIIREKCNGCKKCLDSCEAGAIYMVDDKAQIMTEVCTACGACLNVCEQNAIILSRTELTKMPPKDIVKGQSLISLAKEGMLLIGSALLPLLAEKLTDLLENKVKILGTEYDFKRSEKAKIVPGHKKLRRRAKRRHRSYRNGSK